MLEVVGLRGKVCRFGEEAGGRRGEGGVGGGGRVGGGRGGGKGGGGGRGGKGGGGEGEAGGEAERRKGERASPRRPRCWKPKNSSLTPSIAFAMFSKSSVALIFGDTCWMISTSLVLRSRRFVRSFNCV